MQRFIRQLAGNRRGRGGGCSPAKRSRASAACSRGDKDDLQDLPLDMSDVPAFHVRVYGLVRGIGPGETMTYGEVAQRLGEPSAARAVGQALARNPFAPVVPCHRVLAAATLPAASAPAASPRAAASRPSCGCCRPKARGSAGSRACSTDRRRAGSSAVSRRCDDSSSSAASRAGSSGLVRWWSKPAATAWPAILLLAPAGHRDQLDPPAPGLLAHPPARPRSR